MAESGAGSRYPSARDRWVMVLMWWTVAFMVGLAVLIVVLPGTPPVARMLLAAVMLAPVALIVWLVRTTAYLLTDTEPRVRSGPARWRIPFGAIVRVEPTRGPLSSPALSLKRLRVVRTGSFLPLLISPTPARCLPR